MTQRHGRSKHSAARFCQSPSYSSFRALISCYSYSEYSTGLMRAYAALPAGRRHRGAEVPARGDSGCSLGHSPHPLSAPWAAP